ncbi:hypothetical protein ACOM2C_06665 [Pseudarthrobacter sp. So.54]
MFRAAADKWAMNQGPMKARAAILHSPDGGTHQGIHVRQVSTNAWIVMPEDQAVQLANDIIDIIEARQEREES